VETALSLLQDIPLSREDRVLEIGPGHGAMTKLLLPRCSEVTAVEIDVECVKYLRRNHGGDRRFNLVHQNFMQFDLAGYLKDGPAPWIVGNLPYNVATPIITSVFPHLGQIRGMLAMVQLEVAKRLTAEPGSKSYGSLSVYLRSWGTARILQKVPPSEFVPRPNVMSATLLLEATPGAVGFDAHRQIFVQQCFSQKRKKLVNSLQNFYAKSDVKKGLESLELSENIRAEEMHPEHFDKLYSLLQAK
jgi:16S rRNA (adenine1518-N6/adenine1519-N6)-dimethyltransferase